MTVQRGMKGSGHARWFERSLGELQRSTFLPSNFHYLHLLHKLV